MNPLSNQPTSPILSQIEQLNQMKDEKPSKVLYASYDLFSKNKNQITKTERKLLCKTIELLVIKDPKLKGVGDKMLQEMGKVQEAAQRVINFKAQIKPLTADLVLEKYENNFDEIAKQASRREIFCLLDELADLPQEFIQTLFDQIEEGDMELARKLLPLRPKITENWLKDRPSFQNNELFFLEAIKVDSNAFRLAPKNLQDKESFVLKAVTQDPRVLIDVSEAFKDNEAIVTAAVQKDVLVLGIASDRLKNSNAVVLAAIQKNGMALQFASERVRDSVVVLAAVQKDGRALQFASDRLKNSNAIVLAAVRNNGGALEFASDRLKNLKPVVLAAVKRNGNALRFANFQLRNNPKIYLPAINNNGDALQFLSPQLQNDKKVVLQAVKSNGNSLNHASDELRKDREVIYSALMSDPNALIYVHPSLSEDPEIEAVSNFVRYVEKGDFKKNLSEQIKKIPEDVFYTIIKKIPDVKERIHLAAQREALCYKFPIEQTPIIEISHQNQKFQIRESDLQEMSPPLYDDIKAMQEAAQEMREQVVDRTDVPLSFKNPTTMVSQNVGVLRALAKPEQLGQVFSNPDKTLYSSAFKMLGPFIDKVLTDEEKLVLGDPKNKEITPEIKKRVSANLDLLLGK